MKLDDMTYHDMVYYKMIWHDMTCCNMIWNDVIWYNIISHDLTWHDRTQFDFTLMTISSQWHDRASRIRCLIVPVLILYHNFPLCLSLFVSLPASLSLCLSHTLSLFLSLSLPLSLSIYLSSLSIYLHLSHNQSSILYHYLCHCRVVIERLPLVASKVRKVYYSTVQCSIIYWSLNCS